jgi:hypothetical protein
MSAAMSFTLLAPHQQVIDEIRTDTDSSRVKWEIQTGKEKEKNRGNLDKRRKGVKTIVE